VLECPTVAAWTSDPFAALRGGRAHHQGPAPAVYCLLKVGFPLLGTVIVFVASSRAGSSVCVSSSTWIGSRMASQAPPKLPACSAQHADPVSVKAQSFAAMARWSSVSSTWSVVKATSCGGIIKPY
jgi:hypothetical protein